MSRLQCLGGEVKSDVVRAVLHVTAYVHVRAESKWNAVATWAGISLRGKVRGRSDSRGAGARLLLNRPQEFAAFSPAEGYVLTGISIPAWMRGGIDILLGE